MSLKDLTVAELKQIVEKSLTSDGRLAPDYTDSYELARVVDELAERAWMYEDLTD